MPAPPHPRVIEAAGGVVWRGEPGAGEVAVIHRPHHADWSFPKGKRKRGESWQETALREVLEETACRVEIDRFAGGTFYAVGEHPKVVLYWHMRAVEEGPFEPNDEVDRLVWLTPAAARQRLSRAGERRLLRGF